ncbi:MAG TPA: M12 family metallopeptidase [Myxococcaceae bacterium]|jgi:hypothetical protein
MRRVRGIIDPEVMWRLPEELTPKPVYLDVGFLDGDPGLQAEVLRVAREWSRYANVEFASSGRPAEECQIRISFKLPGAWSYLGKDALDEPTDQPTMNFGWFTARTPQEDIQRVVLHELGHALGLAHEHFHPDGGIPWNKEKVYAWYQENRNWTRERVDDQVLFRYGQTQTVHTAFDFKSIMLYPIPAELTDGKFHTEMNTELSETDKAFIARMYPRPG